MGDEQLCTGLILSLTPNLRQLNLKGVKHILEQQQLVPFFGQAHSYLPEPSLEGLDTIAGLSNLTSLTLEAHLPVRIYGLQFLPNIKALHLIVDRAASPTCLPSRIYFNRPNQCDYFQHIEALTLENRFQTLWLRAWPDYLASTLPTDLVDLMLQFRRLRALEIQGGLESLPASSLPPMVESVRIKDTPEELWVWLSTLLNERSRYEVLSRVEVEVTKEEVGKGKEIEEKVQNIVKGLVIKVSVTSSQC
ncbi:hypothetical protein BDV96DRAFT_692075 [Lophiotrema nucula]|uniref:Uncharacterized protein n=1 Tax=Lophiotrema nucula TaxID=690887 RepID=A0A6A5YS42_9PLEO|nr:hypothetical protein BDV96DRAFT_692075 [Lophiotrema nucula]